MTILKTDVKLDTTTNLGNTLIDGELIMKNSKIYFEAFDILFFGNIDFRGNSDFNLYKRLEYLNIVIQTISENSHFYIFSTKLYIFKNVFLGSEILLNDKTFKFDIDGLIFNPVNESYPISKSAPKIFKWKPKELNTIDFYAIKKNEKQNDEVIWELYVLSLNNEKKIEKVLFNPSKFNINTNELTTFKTCFSDSLIDVTTLESFQTNTVIEFKWDYSLKKFIPLKTRWDKTMNPLKHGNFSTVACSIWNNIMNPIDTTLFTKLKNLNIRDDIYFQNMRKYHNKIKEYLYNTYTKNSNSLLELCVGKGGDLQKWNYNKIKKVYGYDISDKSLNKCIERSKTLNTSFLHYFYKLDLSLHDSSCLIQKHLNNQVSNIACQFALHYFFESQNILDNFFLLEKFLGIS